MADRTIGAAVRGNTADATLRRIIEAEQMGLPAVWLTARGGGGDCLTIFAAAAARTERILLGSSILQTWSRHPVAVAQQVQAIAALAPGRFRLGVGPSHKRDMEQTFGAVFARPLGHLEEYVSILKALFQQGAVDFDGEFYSAHAGIPGPLDVPVMASALRPRSFELCGRVADGAISWVCPHHYVRDVALPAMRSAAEQAGRPVPALVVHAPVSVHEDLDEVREALRQQLSHFPRSPFYARMFAAAGFDGAMERGWTDAMIDAVALMGDEAAVSEQIESLFSAGASELLATVITAGADQEASYQRTLKLLADASRS